MKTIRTKDELTSFASAARNEGKRVGFVPTMGALHDGHLSLVERARSECDTVIVSVFVNPTQFNNPNDLATYPRCEENDFALLEKAGVDAVFAPTADEMYPKGETSGKIFDLGEVAEVMEGKYRPGHFQGVAQIVSMLLRIANPDRAYFGEKDFQQIAVIRRMVATEGIDVEIVSCPIKRADDGLALSSRNALLTAEQRAVAPQIHAILAESAKNFATKNVEQTHDDVVNAINAVPFCKVEYFDIVDGFSLQSVKSWDDAQYIVGCITVYCGTVRLIDNITYKKQETPC